MKKIIALFVSLVLALSVAVAVTAQDAYTATFSITGGDGTITVYDTQDYTSGYTSDTAVARDSDTGE
ncbi:MAG: hypothetical protein K6G71_02580, partial [Clostridiales bacterium]|nr:hypothetical protein [Clostridiales bacterium]